MFWVSGVLLGFRRLCIFFVGCWLLFIFCFFCVGDSMGVGGCFLGVWFLLGEIFGFVWRDWVLGELLGGCCGVVLGWLL